MLTKDGLSAAVHTDLPAPATLDSPAGALHDKDVMKTMVDTSTTRGHSTTRVRGGAGGRPGAGDGHPGKPVRTSQVSLVMS